MCGRDSRPITQNPLFYFGNQVTPWAIGQSPFDHSLKVHFNSIVNVLKVNDMDTQERVKLETSIDEEKEAAAKAATMPTTIDIFANSSKAVYDMLEPHFKHGRVIGIIEECTVSGEDRTKEANSFRVKLAVPSKSDVDAFGVIKYTLQGYWINANGFQEVGKVVNIDLKGYVLQINNAIDKESGKLYHPKWFTRIEKLFDVEKRALLTDQFVMLKNKTEIQGSAMFVFKDTYTPVIKVDNE